MNRFIDTDKWQEIFGTIRKNKLRTFLTSLGVFWGIFMMVFLLGMGSGLENGVWKGFGGRVTNMMFVWAQRTSMPFDGFPAGRSVRLSIEDLAALKDEIPEIKNVAPRTHMGTQPIGYKDKQDSYELRGEQTEMPNIMTLVVSEGRYINQSDLNLRRKVAVIGTAVKKFLFEDDDAIGQHIRIRGMDFKVVGVFGPELDEEWAREDKEAVVIPLSTMAQAFGTNDRLDWFICLAKDGVPVSQMQTKVRALLRQRHNIDPKDPEGIGGFNMEEQVNQIQNLFLGIKFFLWFVGIGTLIAGVVGVSNIMLIIVKERTKEIGIRKALGATPGSIISMIITESIFITSLSGYLGLAFGTIIIWGINSAMYNFDIQAENFYNPEVNMTVGIFSVVVLIIAGAIAGLVPALQASRVNPVVALKDE